MPPVSLRAPIVAARAMTTLTASSKVNRPAHQLLATSPALWPIQAEGEIP